MALAATAFAKQKNRREIIPCVSSIGPGAMNMVTAAGCATANRIPLLVLPGDTFACRQPDPVLQQAEFFQSYGQTVTDAFRGVCHYFDRIERPEQLMTAAIHAMRVLTDPADTGAVCLAMPQDVEGEAYDYPVAFFEKRVWHMDRRPMTQGQLERAVALLRQAKHPFAILGGGVRYSEAGEAFVKLCEQANIPFGETQAGKGTVSWQHPLNMGGVGVTGGKAANVIAQDADMILAVGTRLTDFTTCSKWLFRQNAKVLSLNICPFDAVKMDGEPIICDAREGLTALTGALRLSLRMDGGARPGTQGMGRHCGSALCGGTAPGTFPDPCAGRDQPLYVCEGCGSGVLWQLARGYAAAVARRGEGHLSHGIWLQQHGL